ncbi:hypothetical protein GCM10009863_36430 [Streptomyces axinellae]|uniref:Uncharacterized protein n=1 Tax=Streptomyces axinellae TaxID=552788 RepID=A0ABP6CGD2_9ACTN
MARGEEHLDVAAGNLRRRTQEVQELTGAARRQSRRRRCRPASFDPAAEQRPEPEQRHTYGAQSRRLHRSGTALACVHGHQRTYTERRKMWGAAPTRNSTADGPPAASPA